MPKLRVLSGQDLILILSNFDFEEISQKGSHIKLSRIIDNNNQSITIPNHKEIDKGTLKAIIRQLTNYIPLLELNQYFYHEQ
jgi:predicted RNA binding protein YcfA (HicA-like mRNA interferase family)